jgi:hypothetical protein
MRSFGGLSIVNALTALLIGFGATSSQALAADLVGGGSGLDQYAALSHRVSGPWPAQRAGGEPTSRLACGQVVDLDQ